MSDHTPTPWAYRPNEHDDWGFIRGPDGSLAATARNSRSQDDFDENRRTGTDPYGANAAFIVKAVNAHDALVKALEFFADGNNWMREAACDPNSGNFRGTTVALDALASIKERT